MKSLFEKMSSYAVFVEEYMKSRISNLVSNKDFTGYENTVKPLYDSMEYSLLSPGKRLRPFLTMEFCRIFGKAPEKAVSYAASLEMVHAFSLIHDDLPCMDDDDMRRGRPTNHKVFGEACALLAGDALCFLPFETILDNDFPDSQNMRAVKILASCAGAAGMIAGQQIDMWAENNTPDEDILVLLQKKKTGALFTAACLLGCTAAGKGPGDREYSFAAEYASHAGLAFQIADDILDVCGDSKLLGKNAGSDEKNGKTTFVTLLGLEGARMKALEESELAKAAVDSITNEESEKKHLKLLADYFVQRNK